MPELDRRLALIALSYDFDENGQSFISRKVIDPAWGQRLGDDQQLLYSTGLERARRDLRFRIRYRSDILEIPEGDRPRWYLDEGGYVYFVTDAAEDPSRNRRRFVIVRCAGGGETRAQFDERTTVSTGG